MKTSRAFPKNNLNLGTLRFSTRHLEVEYVVGKQICAK